MRRIARNKNIGAAIAAIAISGTWAFAGYMSYLDIQMGGAANISPLLMEAAGSESDGPDEGPPPK